MTHRRLIHYETSRLCSMNVFSSLRTFYDGGPATDPTVESDHQAVKIPTLSLSREQTSDTYITS